MFSHASEAWAQHDANALMQSSSMIAPPPAGGSGIQGSVSGGIELRVVPANLQGQGLSGNVPETAGL